MRTKRKTIGGHEYVILGSTTEMERGRVVYQSYTVPGGKVKVEHGKVWHRDGTITDLDGNIIEAEQGDEARRMSCLHRKFCAKWTKAQR